MKVGFYKLVSGVLGVKLLGSLGSFLVSVILARQLSMSDTGEFFSQLATITILAIIISFGFNNYCLKKLSKYYDTNKTKDANNLVTTCLCITMISGSCVIGIYHLVTLYISELPGYKHFDLFIFAIIPIALSGIMSNVLQALGKPRTSMVFTGVIRNIIFLIFIVIIIMDTASSSKFWFLLASIMSFSMSLFFWFIYKGRISFSNSIGIESMSILKESKDYWYISIIAMLSSQLPLIFTGLLSTFADAAEIAIVIRVATVSALLLVAINRVVSPGMATTYIKGDIANLKKIINRSTKLISAFSTVYTAFILLFSQQILNIFGNGYLGAELALYIVLLSQWINSIFGSVGTVLQMSDYAKYQRRAVLFSIVISIIVGWVLIPNYGAVGASVMFATFMIISNVISWYFVKSKIGVNTLLIYKVWN